MNFTRRGTVATFVLVLGLGTPAAPAQQVTEETHNGVRYQVTRNVVQRQVPVTVMQDRNQTVYAQQITTDNLTHQQLYSVPLTQYRWDSRLRGRWNPFITPYWTHSLRPVTTWHQQVASVQIPVSRVAWVPQTKTVQVPVTQYRTAEEETVTRVALDTPRTFANSQPLTARSATIAARPSDAPIGGVRMENDPPRQATGWQSPSDSRYR